MPKTITRNGETLYVVRVRDGRGGTFPQETYRDRQEAETRENALKRLALKSQGKPTGHLDRRATVGEYLEEWHADRVANADAYELSAKYLASEESRIRAWLSTARTSADQPPPVGTRRLDKLGPDDFDRLRRAMLDAGRSPSYIADVTKTLTVALSDAYEDGRILSVPRPRRRRRRGKQATRKPTYRILSVDEVYLLADVAATFGGDTARVVVLTAAQTGMRWSEIAGLRARYLDLDAGRLQVEETISEVRGELIVKGPKTASSQRTVSLGGSLVDELRQHRFAVGDGYVFTDAKGGPLRYSNFRRRVFYPAAAQLDDPAPTFHDLRHTHATMLLGQGRPVPEVAARLGHENPAVTLRLYAHYMPGSEESAAVMDDLFGQSRAPGAHLAAVDGVAEGSTE